MSSKTKSSEPAIVSINGTALSIADALVLRDAVSFMAHEMSADNPLGNDKQSQYLAGSYRRGLALIASLLGDLALSHSQTEALLIWRELNEAANGVA
ncbi:hypothetical protein ACXIUS_19535 [Bosea thiooxidans]